jgi:hypothetical protein
VENVGSCEMAGMLVRNLVLQVAEAGKKHRIVDGRIFIDGTGNDRSYCHRPRPLPNHRAA